MRFHHQCWLILAMVVCVLRMVSCGHVPVSCTDVPDCITLRQLQTETGPSKLDRLWDEAHSYCDWTGVTCTGSGRVSGLDLKSMNLKGPIPLAVGKLSQLASLDLSNNLLSDGIPPQLLDNLGQLTHLDLSNNKRLGNRTVFLPDRFPANLTYLNLRECGFVGEIPGSLVHLPFLTTLSLSHNYLNGTIPPSLGQLQGHVQFLDLSYNSLQGPIPDAFGNLTFGESGYLSLAGNNLTGTLPPLIVWWELSTLDVQRNNLRGPLPAYLGALIALGKLEVLRLSENNFTGGLALDSLASCSLQGLGVKSQCCNLKEVRLDWNNLEGPIPREFIDYCSGLITLSLRHNKLKGQLQGNVSGVSALKHLDLSFNKLSGAIEGDWISRFESLEELFLGHNELSGAIPREVGNLRALQVLQLSTNQLEGVIPSELENCNFTFFSLSNNKLRGQIPAWLGQLKHLKYLDLSANSFTDIPQELYVSLSSNGLTADESTLTFGQRDMLIRELKEYLQLTERTLKFITSELMLHEGTNWSPGLIIDFSRSRLGGPIPYLHTSLKRGRLSYLDMSHNNLVGGFPAALLFLLRLSFLDLSWNHFDGQIPIGALQVRNFSDLNLDCNEFDNADDAAAFFPRMRNSFRNRRTCEMEVDLLPSEKAHALRVHNTVALTVLFLLLLAVVFGLIRNRRGRGRFCTWKSANDAVVVPPPPAISNQEGNNRNYGGASKRLAKTSTSLEQFYILLDEEAQQDTNMHDIITATNNFNDNNILGYGGFGMVYKACLPDGQVLAVKKLRSGGQQGEREFQAEIKTLGKIRHRNLVELKGYCKYNDERLLIYTFMENGCLDWWLHQAEEGPSVLDWPKRLHIAHDAASGLCFLHHFLVPRIIHRDIKASNILLDATFTAHIADFGLARILEPSCTHLTTTISGTLGYIDPASVESSMSTLEMDVYSFGVVLLELVTGRRANVHVKEHGTRSLAKWVHLVVCQQGGRASDVVDPALVPHLSLPSHCQQVQQLLILGCRCTHGNPASRPSMRNVVKAIDNMLAMENK